MDFPKESERLYDEGNFEKCLSVCKLWCKKEPDNKRAWYSLGSIYIALKRYDIGIENLEIALNLAPTDFYSLSNMGSAYCCKSEYKKAIPYFIAAKENSIGDEQLMEALSKLADCYLCCHQPKKAAPLIEQLYGLDEDLALTLEGKFAREIIPGHRYKPWYKFW